MHDHKQHKDAARVEGGGVPDASAEVARQPELQELYHLAGRDEGGGVRGERRGYLKARTEEREAAWREADGRSERAPRTSREITTAAGRDEVHERRADDRRDGKQFNSGILPMRTCGGSPDAG